MDMVCCGTRVFDRKDFLRVSGAGIVGTGILGLAGCAGSGQGSSGTVVHAEAPDDTGTLQKLLDGFNKKYEGKYKVVKYREMPADTGGATSTSSSRNCRRARAT